MTKPGECRVCGCSGDCKLRNGDECGWSDKTRTLCTNDACITADARRRKTLEAVSKRKQPRVNPWRVVRRDPATGRATRIVRNRQYRSKGRAA